MMAITTTVVIMVISEAGKTLVTWGEVIADQLVLINRWIMSLIWTGTGIDLSCDISLTQPYFRDACRHGPSDEPTAGSRGRLIEQTSHVLRLLWCRMGAGAGRHAVPEIGFDGTSFVISFY